MTEDYSDMNKGIAVWPEGGSNYGHLIKWEPPSNFFKAGALSIMEIVKAPQAQQGWKPKMSKVNDQQRERGTYNRRVYLWRDQIHGILEAINRVMTEALGESGPDVESPFQYQKGAKADRAVDSAVDEFGEFSTAPETSEGGDEGEPF